MRETRSINDLLLSESKSLQHTGNIPHPSYGTGWGAIQGFESEAAWSSYLDSMSSAGSTNNIQKYRTLVGDLSRNSLIMAAVRFLGDALPEAPLQEKIKKGGASGEKGKSEVVAASKAVKLWNKPNEFYSGSTLKRGLAFSLVLASNAYIIKNFDNNGAFPIELWWEPHWTCRPVWPTDGSEFISNYEVYRQGEWLPIATENVIHIRDGMHPYNLRIGLSGNDSILRELYGDGEAANYYASLMGGSGIPGFLVGIDKDVKIDQPGVERMEKMIVSKTTGERKGQPMIIKGGRAYKLGYSPREMNLVETRYMAEDRFCATQGIPAVVLELGSGQAHSIYNNVNMAMERAWRSYVCPKLTMIEEELTNNFLPDFYDKAPEDEGRYLMHDLGEVQALQEDVDAKAKRHGQLLKDGVEKRSEARSALGLGSSIEGDEEVDNVFYISGSTQILKPGEIPAAPDPGMGFGEPGNTEEALGIDQAGQTALSAANGGKPTPKLVAVKGMPTAKSGLNEKDIQGTISYLKRLRMQKAVNLMTAGKMPPPRAKKSNGDSHVIG